MSYDFLPNRLNREAVMVSIPLEKGNVLRRYANQTDGILKSLNPFGTGQCLTTEIKAKVDDNVNVSIPLEQGNVLRLKDKVNYKMPEFVSIPLEQGNVLRPMTDYTNAKEFVSIPLEQGNVLRHLKVHRLPTN